MAVKRFIKSVLGPGLYRTLHTLREETAMHVRHAASTRKARRLGTRGLMINCACGPNYKPGWVNIDAFAPRADLRLDLRRPFPFADEAADIVYSEHFFEHLEHPADTSTYLAESLRILRRGGRFRVGVPNAERALKAYVANETAFFERARERWNRPPWCDTPMHNVNYLFRQGAEHKYAYDFETLAKMLSEAGFANVERSDFDPALDCETRIGSLYIEATKP